MTFELPMDGDDPSEVMHVLVPRKTGLVYRHQYGGHLCHHAEVEGFMVAAWAHPHARQALDHIFLVELAKRGTDELADPQRDEVVERVDQAVRRIWYRGTSERNASMTVDRSRADELDEAWVPVNTPDGPGYLAWINSD